MFFLSQIIKYLLIATMFIPLIVGGDFNFPYIAPKIFVFEIIVEIIFLLWLWLILKKPEYRPKKNILTISLSLFFAILIITAFTGVNPNRSFFMDYERMDGIFHLLHFYVFFLVLSSFFRKRSDWEELFALSVLVSPIVALTFQRIYNGRLSGSLGNPDFIACYAIFNLAFALFLIYSAWQKISQKRKNLIWPEIIYLSIGGIGLLSTPLMLWMSGTRGAILAFAIVIGLNILILPWIRYQRKYILSPKWRKGLIVLIFTGLLIVGGLYLARNNSKINNLVSRSHTLKRLTHISVHSGTVRNRLLVWQYGWEGFKERPIRGWGWDNFLVSFNKHYTTKLSEPWFDKAHNEYLDVLVASGIFGLLSYLFVFFSSFYLLQRYFRGGGDFWIFWIFTSLIIFYLLQNISLFDTPAIYLMIFTVLGFIAWLSSSVQKGISQKSSKEMSLNSLGWGMYGAIVLLIIIISYQWVIKPARASYLAIKGLEYYQLAVHSKVNARIGISESQRLISQSLDLHTYGSPEVIKLLTEQINEPDKIDIPLEQKQQYLSWANQKISQVVQEFSSDDVRYLIALTNFQISHYRYDRGTMAQAEKTLQGAVLMSPYRPTVWQNLGWTQLFQGKKSLAIQSFQQAVKLSYHHLPQAKYFLGLAYYSDHQDKMAKENLQAAAKYGYKPAKDFLKEHPDL